MPRPHLRRRHLLTTTAVLCAVTALSAGHAAAHTETDVVAVPAGSEARVALRPTHGCGDSPTVAVRIRAPFEGATAGDVAGWTATATPDGSGNTVLEWSGGVLPADETGSFPVEFVVPDAVGTLLVFPAVQRCENGDELAWINGDPAAEYPAPRVLVLPADAEPAATIDDVPLDAPGRDQLVAIVDVDAPTTTTPATTTPATSPPTTSEPAPTAATTAAPAGTSATTPPPSSTAPSTSTAPAGGDDGTAVGPGVAIAVIVAIGALAAGGVLLVRRRRD